MRTDIEVVRLLIKELDDQRKAARGDVARELSLAITHLEDAAHRMGLAHVRASRPHPADAANALKKHEPEVVGVVEDTTETKEG